MAIVHLVKKARASKTTRICTRCRKVLHEGDKLFWFANRLGATSIVKYFCADHPPRASDKTTSDKLARLYQAQEGLQDLLQGSLTPDNVNDFVEALTTAAETAREVGEEYEESRSNMESAFPNGCPVMEELEEKKDACESWADELDNAAQELSSADAPNREDFDTDEEYETELEIWEDTNSTLVDDAAGALEI